MMDEVTIRKVFGDEQFVKGLFELATPEEVQAALQQKDLSLSVEEIVKIRELLLKRMEAGAELSEEELESVTGGVGVTILIISLMIGAVVLGVVAGAGAVGGAYIVNDKTNGTW